MANETMEFFEKFKKAAGKMNELSPDSVGAFMAMFGKIMKAGALSEKQKELIALAMGVCQHCSPCIQLHVQKALAAGATKEEIVEAAFVAVMMAGGPAFTHIPVVIDTLEALQA